MQFGVHLHIMQLILSNINIKLYVEMMGKVASVSGLAITTRNFNLQTTTNINKKIYFVSEAFQFQQPLRMLD